VQQFRTRRLVMKGGTQAALALGIGYLLGRKRKMRMASMLAAGAAAGGATGLGGLALRRGMKMLGSTEMLGKFAPQLGELADTVRSDLVDAGKAAATAAVSSRIDSLTDSLHERAELVRNPGAAATEVGKTARSGAGKAAETARSGAGQATRRVRRRDQEPAGDEGDEFTEEEEPYAEEAEEPEDYESEAEEPEADEPEAEEAEPDEPEAEEAEPDEPRTRRRTATRSRSAESEAPVRRRTTTRRRSPAARAGR
jgi:hypothetical protein